MRIELAWIDDAACREHPEVNFHPNPHRGEDVTPAKLVCSTCLVRAECLDYALGLPRTADHGVMGGRSARERQRLRRRTSAA